MALKQLKILGVKVSVTTKAEVLDFVTARLKKKQKFFISTPNPEMVVAAQSNPRFITALNSADIALPDGVGILYAAKFLGLDINKRIPGREVFTDLLGLANKHALKVYLLGATAEVNQKAIEKTRKTFPKANVKGNSGPTYNNQLQFVKDSDRKLESYIVRDINQFKPDFLFVAFGAPKQELWVNKHFSNLKVGGAMTVGGSFDYFVGKTTTPPGWVARVGLEWLWRVLLEPARFERILNATVVFPLLVLRARILKR